MGVLLWVLLHIILWPTRWRNGMNTSWSNWTHRSWRATVLLNFCVVAWSFPSYRIVIHATGSCSILRSIKCTFRHLCATSSTRNTIRSTTRLWSSQSLGLMTIILSRLNPRITNQLYIFEKRLENKWFKITYFLGIWLCLDLYSVLIQ